VRLYSLGWFKGFIKLTFDCGNSIKMKDPYMLNSNLKDALNEGYSIHKDLHLSSNFDNQIPFLGALISFINLKYLLVP
jgi:hypothetical protein